MLENSLMDFNGPRTPYEFEWDAVTELGRSVFFKDSPSYLVGARTWPMGLRAEARENAFAMFHEGHPVSVIGRLERDMLIHGHILRIGYIGGVCTHPDYRKLGLASTVLAATMKRFHENNVDFVCISGNRKMYRDAGSRFIGGVNRFILRKGFSVDGMFTLREATAEDFRTLARINQSESLRFIRPLSDYEVVINYGHCVGRPVRFIIAYIGSVPAAYILITDLLKHDERSFRRVMEYAGDRQAILSALSMIINEATENEIEIDIQSGDIMEELIRSRGVCGLPATRPGTFCVIDIARTMNKLKPLFASYFPIDLVNSIESASGRGRYAIWCDGGSIEIEDETNLVWMALGTPPGETIGKIRVTGTMNDFADICLPIPLPPLELNMI